MPVLFHILSILFQTSSWSAQGDAHADQVQFAADDHHDKAGEKVVRRCHHNARFNAAKHFICPQKSCSRKSFHWHFP